MIISQNIIHCHNNMKIWWTKIPIMKINRFFKRSEDESLFLYQVGLQYAKTILLLKVRQHNFNSHGDPYMSSLTMPATHSKVRHTIPVTKCLNHWVYWQGMLLIWVMVHLDLNYLISQTIIPLKQTIGIRSDWTLKQSIIYCGHQTQTWGGG